MKLAAYTPPPALPQPIYESPEYFTVAAAIHFTANLQDALQVLDENLWDEWYVLLSIHQ